MVTNRRAVTVALATAVAASTLLAACGSSGSKNSGGGSTGDPGSGLPSTITIGSPLDTSGPAAAAAVGVSEQKGEQLAADEINSSGFLGSSKINLKVADTQTQTTVAVQTMIGMTKTSKVNAIVGFTLSASFLASGKLAQSAGIPVITVDLSDTGITEVGDYIYRIAPASNDIYKATDPKILQDLGAKTAAYLYDSDSANVEGQSTFRRQENQAAGIKTVADESVTSDAISFQAQLTKIKSANPDVLIVDLNGGQEPTFLRQAAQAGLKVDILGDIGLDVPSVIQTPQAQCATFATIWDESSTAGKNQQFLSSYKSKYNATPDLYAAEGYDAVWMMATAMKNAKSVDGSKVRDALATLKNFSGALGVYGFGPDRSPTITPLIFHVQDKQAVAWKPGGNCQL